MVGRIFDWVDDRVGVRQLLGIALEEEVPGGARLRYVFGSVLVFLFMQQVVLGVLLATYYSPSATAAWASTAYIQDQVTAGWFLRGLHHHGSSAMVVVTLLHFVQVVVAGAYRAPREFNWWVGLMMAGAVGAFALTGYLLPWDQKGYWATQVATGIMGGVPMGEFQQQMVQGGNEYGNLTLTRFYVLHVFVLPGLLIGLITAHIYLFRRHGVTPPANLSEKQLAEKSQPFWPNQLFLDVCAMAVTGGVLVWLTYQTHGAELFAPADPASNFVARPEWYFLFLFQLLKYFEGPLAIIATVIIPGAIVLFLFALPFLDRAKSRRPIKRMPVLSIIGLMMAGVVALSALAVVADANNEDHAEGLALAHENAERARALALEGVPPAGGLAVWHNDPEYQAMELFKEHCEGCHDIDGRGSDDAPSLRHFNDREWLRGAVREPRSRNYFGGTENHEDMEAFSAKDLPDSDLDALIEYMVELRGDGVAFDAKLAKLGAEMWDDSDCSGCHEIEKGTPGAGSPTLEGRGSYDWIVRVITDSGQPDLYDEYAEMPKFGEKISEDEVHTLAWLVLSQGGFAELEVPPAREKTGDEDPAGKPAAGEAAEGTEAEETGTADTRGDQSGTGSE